MRVGLEDAPFGCAAHNVELAERAARVIAQAQKAL